jgi:hypothetical protein
MICLASASVRKADAVTVQHLRVDDSSVINTIDYPFWGVNYVAFWDSIQGSDASQRALQNAGVQVIRFPGGEPANWYDWASPLADGWSSTSTDSLWSYAQPIGAKLLLQTNPTTQHNNDPSGTHAAGWVDYTVQHGIDAPFWEVGNEPDLQLTNDFDQAALQWYINAFNEQAAAMHSAYPAIKVLGPAGTNAWQWWALHSLDVFLEQTGNLKGSGQVDGVSLHYYPAQGCAGWNNVIGVAQSWPEYMDQIKRVIAAYDSRPLPVFISETNAAVGGLNCEINQTMAAALANADLFGAYRSSGVHAIQFFGSVHGGNGWGMLYGAGEVRPADTPTPTYFIFPIWTRAGNQVLSVLGATDPSTTLSAYAAKKPDGSVQILVINKTDQPMPVTLSFTSFNPTGGVVQVYQLQPAAGGVWDKDVIYNGAQAPAVTGPALPPPASYPLAKASYESTVPAYSLTLFDFHQADDPIEKQDSIYLPLTMR